MPDYDALNSSVYSRCLRAGAKLAKAWDEGGRGGPNSEWELKCFADWFEDVYRDVADLLSEDELHSDTAAAALDACEDILCQDVTHDQHVKFIVRLRLWLDPDTEWSDAIHSAKEREESGATLSIGTTELIVEWPCDITGMEDSDIEEEETQFQMDDV